MVTFLLAVLHLLIKHGRDKHKENEMMMMMMIINILESDGMLLW